MVSEKELFRRDILMIRVTVWQVQNAQFIYIMESALSQTSKYEPQVIFLQIFLKDKKHRYFCTCVFFLVIIMALF